MADTMVECSEVVDSARQLQELTRQAIASQTADAFESLEARFSHFDKLVRTTLQSWSFADVERIAKKLEGGGMLTPAEKEVLREVIAGDASACVTIEDSVQGWVDQLIGLADQICSRSETLEAESVPALRTAIQNALRLLPTLRQYAAERERLERFDHAVSDLSPTARRVLAESLRVRLEHPDL